MSINTALVAELLWEDLVLQTRIEAGNASRPADADAFRFVVEAIEERIIASRA